MCRTQTTSQSNIDKLQYEKYLTQVWDKCFKVLDDIKETVRVAAAALARVLTTILTRSLEAGDASVKSANAQLTRVLPIQVLSLLLKKCVSSQCKPSFKSSRKPTQRP
jgi:hypothetical protein